MLASMIPVYILATLCEQGQTQYCRPEEPKVPTIEIVCLDIAIVGKDGKITSQESCFPVLKK